MIQLPPDFKEFLQLLNSRGVEYLVVGGYAVGFYGYPRSTGDMDVYVNNNVSNINRLAEALKEFGSTSRPAKWTSGCGRTALRLR